MKAASFFLEKKQSIIQFPYLISHIPPYPISRPDSCVCSYSRSLPSPSPSPSLHIFLAGILFHFSFLSHFLRPGVHFFFFFVACFVPGRLISCYLSLGLCRFFYFSQLLLFIGPKGKNKRRRRRLLGKDKTQI